MGDYLTGAERRIPTTFLGGVVTVTRSGFGVVGFAPGTPFRAVSSFYQFVGQVVGRGFKRRGAWSPVCVFAAEEERGGLIFPDNAA